MFIYSGQSRYRHPIEVLITVNLNVWDHIRMPSAVKGEGTNNSQIMTLKEACVHIKKHILTARICTVNITPAKIIAYLLIECFIWASSCLL